METIAGVTGSAGRVAARRLAQCQRDRDLGPHSRPHRARLARHSARREPTESLPEDDSVGARSSQADLPALMTHVCIATAMTLV
jgi:hypothetical protein